MSDTDIVEIDSKMVRVTRERKRKREAWTPKLDLILFSVLLQVSICKMWVMNVLHSEVP